MNRDPYKLETPAVVKEPTIADLAMLVARLIRQVRKHDAGNEVAEKAMGYLRRHDLQGSILRKFTQDAEARVNYRRIFDETFKVAVGYGDNWLHCQGEQADRVFEKILMRLGIIREPAPTEPTLPTEDER